MNMNLVNNENTTDKAHSIFPPSSAERYMNCSMSLVMERLFPNTTSFASEEGTAAHALGEWKARKALGLDYPKERPTSEYDNEEMEVYTTGYAQFIKSQYENYLSNPATENCSVMLERTVDVSKYIPECYGTADCIIINDKVLHIIDLKYGMTKVEAENNYQLRLYALGALSLFDMLYDDIDTVRLTIYQPRVFTVGANGQREQNIPTWEISRTDLINWGNIYAKPRALMALAGEGTCTEGSWCKYCKAQCICSLKRDKVVNEFSMADLEKKGVVMSDEEIINILENGSDISKWIKSVQDYALASAVDGSREWKGYKLADGKASRVFKSEQEVADRALTIPGFNTNSLYTTDFVSVAKLEKAMGKKEFAINFGDLVEVEVSGKKLVKDETKNDVSTIPSPVAPKTKKEAI